MILPKPAVPRCRSRVKIGEQIIPEWGCGSVRIGDEWAYMTPAIREAYNTVDGSMCPMCRSLLEVAQRRASMSEASDTARAKERGFGPAPDGEDPFKGMREE